MSLFSQFEFGQPLFLFLLILLPLIWLGRHRLSLAAILWRSIVLLLLVLALADPRGIKQPSVQAPAGERIFAFDLSRSVSPEMRIWMARQNLLPQSGDRVFVFGGAVEEVQDWERWLKGEAPLEGIKPEETNLEVLFATLLSLPRRERSLFLFTDGWQTAGDAARLIPSLAQAGIKVYPMLPPERPATTNVAVKRVVAASQSAQGEAVHLNVQVENNDTKEIEGSLVLKRNGRPLRNEPVRLQPGSQMLSYQAVVGEGALQSFQAEFTPRRAGADTFAEDNQATAWVAVRNKEKVLLLNGRAGEGNYLEEMLKRRGFEVSSLVAGNSPPSLEGYGFVILNNVQRDLLQPAYLSAIERQVNAGNGLLVLGDESGLPPGAYRQSPLGPVLPVEIVEPKKEDKSRAVILVIDKSRSMDMEENRLFYAKEVARNIIGQLREDDFIGVIAVDTRPFTVVPLGSTKSVRPKFRAALENIQAGGNSYLLPGLQEALRQFQNQPAGRRHLILLTDADEIKGSQSEYVDLVAYMKSEGKIRVSTVGIGNRVDVSFIKRIAAYGGGVYHLADTPSKLPQVVFQAIAEEPQKTPRQEKDYVPALARGSEILAGLPERFFPPLKGYVESELKKGARVDLALPNDSATSPLLVSWRYGKGKAVVFTADQAGRWSKDWIPWGGLERFWGKVFDWLAPERETLPAHEVRINLVDEQPVLDFYLYSQEFDGNVFRYSYSAPKGSRGEGLLKRQAPGHYQSRLPFTTPGDYRIEIKEEQRGSIVGYPVAGFTLPVKAKGDVFKEGFHLPLLDQIAHSSGGAFNSGPDQAPTMGYMAAKMTFLRSYFILLATLVFLLEVFFRRFFMGEN